LDCLGQLRPGDAVRFKSVSIEQAEEAYRLRGEELQNWLVRIRAISG
jgi:allophanate hydrolase subunit 2